MKKEHIIIHDGAKIRLWQGVDSKWAFEIYKNGIRKPNEYFSGFQSRNEAISEAKKKIDGSLSGSIEKQMKKDYGE